MKVKVLAYAGDVAFLCSDKRNLDETLKLTASFCKITGAQLYSERSSVKTSHRSRPVRPGDIHSPVL